jgi:hypothetical protein
MFWCTTQNEANGRMFVDSSKLRLKAVLLHNGSVLPAVPFGCAISMKESHDNMKLFVNCINDRK